MKLKHFGEFELIDRIKKKIDLRGTNTVSPVIVGIGDAGAILITL